jgi:hypothetical protein
MESTDNYTKQLGLITEIEKKYNLEEGILLSHFFTSGWYYLAVYY